MNQPLKALISARAKKFIANHLLQTFTSKEHNNSQGFFPTMIGFVTLGHLLFIGDCAKKVAKGDKANHGWEKPCELLCSFEVKFCNKWLAMNFLVLADIKALSG